MKRRKPSKGPRQARPMDPNVREAAIETIARYAKLGTDFSLFELVGFHTARGDIADEVILAVIVAALPLLADERLNILMSHIAEVLVNTELEKAEVAA